MKTIWVPKSETKVIVQQNGSIQIFEEMLMEAKPINTKSGFTK